MQSRMPNEPCDSSTPAKATTQMRNSDDRRVSGEQVPRQTIQQLAQLVMKSARWRDATANERAHDRWTPPNSDEPVSGSNIQPRRDQLNVATRNVNEEETLKRAQDLRDKRRSYAGEVAERESRDKALGWLQDRYSYGGGDRPNAPYDAPPSVPLAPHNIGFTTENLNVREDKGTGHVPVYGNAIGFNPDILVSNDYPRRNVAFADLERPRTPTEKTGQVRYQRQRRQAPEPPQQQRTRYYDNNIGQFSTLPVVHRSMIDRYVQDSRGPIIQKTNEKGGQESDDDDEFLDTTASMQPARKNSLTLSGTSSGKGGNCVIS